MSAFARTLETLGARRNEPLARHTTWGVGGPADWYLRAEDTDTLAQLAGAAQADGVSITILGSGSNVLVGDGGIRGLTIENRAADFELNAEVGSVVRAQVDAGMPFARLARATARRGVSGLEWSAGIPGTLGGAVVYNAGAYGGCLADVLTEIETIGPDGERCRMSAADLGLSYRRSDFTRGRLAGHIIVRVTLSLSDDHADRTLPRVEELEARRKASTPPGRSAGSTFKNPPGGAAWRLIDAAGMRGCRIGGAQVSEKHANYFLNADNARAADLQALIQLTRRRVFEQSGVQLEPEVSLIGEGFDHD